MTARHRHSSLLGLFALFAGICVLLSCAAEAPPHPPRVQRPAPVTDLVVLQRGRTLRLSFTPPALATDRRRLTKPIEVWIYRHVTPASKRLPRAFMAVRPWVSLPPSILPRYTRGGKILYESRFAPHTFSHLIGSTFSFMVVTSTRSLGGRLRKSDPSKVCRIKLLNVSPPIRDLRVVITPAGLVARWSAPSRGLAGEPIPLVVGYLIYRGRKAGRPHLLAQTSLTHYLDQDFQFDRTYFYRVRAVFEEDRTRAESANSLPSVITPHDIFPPPVPTGLTAVYTGRSVELIWKPDAPTGLAGYNVYRRQGAGPPERINGKLLLTAVYADRTVRKGRQYLYWVTAVSVSGHESEPSAPREVETR